MTYRLPLQDAPEREQEQHQCWSAAYESWTTACARIIPGARAVSEEAIEAELAQYPGAISENGGASRAGIGLLQLRGDVQFEGVAGNNLSEELLVSRLTSFGYIYLAFWGRGQRTGRIFSHAVVISNAARGRMRVMDPGRGRGLMTQSTQYYQSAIVMLLGTHKRAHGV